MAALELFVNANTWKQQLEIAKLSYFPETSFKEEVLLTFIFIRFTSYSLRDDSITFSTKKHNYIIWWFAYEKCACLLPNLGMKEIKSPEETIACIYFARQKNDFEIFTSCPSYPEGVKMFTTMHNLCCCFWYIKVDHHHK